MIILLLVCTLVWHLDNIVINKMFKLETTDKLYIHKLKPQLKRYKKKEKSCRHYLGQIYFKTLEYSTCPVFLFYFGFKIHLKYTFTKKKKIKHFKAFQSLVVKSYQKLHRKE